MLVDIALSLEHKERNPHSQSLESDNYKSIQWNLESIKEFGDRNIVPMKTQIKHSVKANNESNNTLNRNALRSVMLDVVTNT